MYERHFDPSRVNFIREEGKVAIGKAQLTAFTQLTEWNATPGLQHLIDVLNKPTGEHLRHSLAVSLTTNTANERRIIGHARATSAFFMYDPVQKLVTVEYGQIDMESKESKLHDYLRENLDYYARRAQGMTLRSGHIGISSLYPHMFALMDCLTRSKKPVEPGSEDAVFINTFHHFGIIPVTADGYIQLPIPTPAA